MQCIFKENLLQKLIKSGTFLQIWTYTNASALPIWTFLLRTCRLPDCVKFPYDCASPCVSLVIKIKQINIQRFLIPLLFSRCIWRPLQFKSSETPYLEFPWFIIPRNYPCPICSGCWKWSWCYQEIQPKASNPDWEIAGCSRRAFWWNYWTD